MAKDQTNNHEQPQPEVHTHREVSRENFEARLDGLYATLEDWGTRLAGKLSTEEIGTLNHMLSEFAALCPSRPTHPPMQPPAATVANPPLTDEQRRQRERAGQSGQRVA